MIERYTKPGPIARLIRWLFGKRSRRIAVERLRIAVGKDRWVTDCERDLLQRGRH